MKNRGHWGSRYTWEVGSQDTILFFTSYMASLYFGKHSHPDAGKLGYILVRTATLDRVLYT